MVSSDSFRSSVALAREVSLKKMCAVSVSTINTINLLLCPSFDLQRRDLLAGIDEIG